jgi:monoamine oxidase
MAPTLDADVVIVGAGVAGLAAASTLGAQGLAIIVLEAADRAGGRAHTIRLGRTPVDLGASWFHMAAQNPLAHIAQNAGIPTPKFGSPHRLTALQTPSEPPHFADPADRESAEQQFAAIFENAKPHQDISVQYHLIRSGIENPWFPTLATMEGAIFSAADLPDLSLADWHENELDDDNLWVGSGMGAFVTSQLLPQAGEIRTNAPVDSIDWNAPNGTVLVSGPRGSIRAAACILTVSTGVLASGAIRFPTPLPATTAQAIADLPMGLLSKIIFPATEDLLALAPDTGLDHRVAEYGDPAMVFIARPQGDPIVIGHVGGRAAWDLSRAGPAATQDFARAELAAIFGERARAWLPDDAAITSGWGENPLFAGAYSYGRPGCGDARDILAQPIGEGRLCIAGEACHRGMAGTVQAAWITGVKAAEAVGRKVGWTVPVPPNPPSS